MPCYAMLQPAEVRLFFRMKWMCRLWSSVQHMLHFLGWTHVAGAVSAEQLACSQSTRSTVCTVYKVSAMQSAPPPGTTQYAS